MKKLVMLISLLVGFTEVFAQNFCVSPGYLNESCYSYDIRPCNNGYILTGSHSDRNGNALLIRLSESGQVLWRKSLGEEGVESGYRLAVQDDGFLVLARYQPENAGAYGIRIFKVDTSGNLVSDWIISQTDWDIAEGICALPDGGFIVLSTRTDSVSCIVSRRFRANGELAWERKLSDTLALKGSDLLLAQNGRIYIAGEYDRGTQRDLLFAAYDTDGNLLFRKITGTERDEACSGLTENNSGELVVSATYFYENQIGQLYLQSFDSEGNEVLRVAENNNVNKRIGRIVWNGAGKYLIPYSLLLDFGEKLTGYYEFDHWLTFVCEVKLEGQKASVATAVIPSAEGGGVLTGYTENPVPSLPQIFVLKAGDNCQTPPITLRVAEHPEKQLNIYPNPAQNSFYIELPAKFAPQNARLSMIGSEGKTYYPQWEISGQALCVQLNGFAPGIYLVQLLMQDEIYTYRIIISSDQH